MSALIILILSTSLQPADAALTNAASVRAFFRDASSAPPRPVALKNVVVTYHNFGNKNLYVQDDSGGVQVRMAADVWPDGVRVGDVVSVTGTTDAGNLFHAVTASKIDAAKRRQVVKPEVFDLSPIRAQWFDGKAVSASGRVRNRQVIDGETRLTLERRGGEVTLVYLGGKIPPEAGVGATLAVNGVCATEYTRGRRVSRQPRILVSEDSQLDIQAAGRPDLFDTDPVNVLQIKELGAISGEGRDLVKLTGVLTAALTAQQPARVFVQDAGGGVVATLAAGEKAPAVGSRVEVVGTPAEIDGGYGLGDCQIRKVGTGQPVQPLGVPLEQLAGGGFRSRLVRVEGAVMDVAFAPNRVRVSVFDRGQFAEAFLESPDQPVTRALVAGARVSLVGVCDVDRAGGVVLRLRTAADIEVTTGPPFWTGDRVWALLGGFGAVCVFGTVVVLLLRTQVRRAAGQIQRQFDERARMQDQFLQASRLEAVGRLAGGVAHEFNNLLTVINGCATLLTETVDGGTPAELADDIRRAGERAADLSGQLLTISRPKAVAPQAMDLNAAVRNTTRLIGRAVGERVTLRIETDVGLPVVKADPSLVSQIIFNLVMNARDAMPDGGTITVRTSTVADGPVNWARLTVTDTGTGMTEDVRARMFEPFFTTKVVGKGTGLGLAIVNAHAKALGGRVRCETAAGRGTTFDVDLPTIVSVADDMTPLPPPLAMPTPLSGEFETVVLVVEDDDAVRNLALRILELRGLTVLTADGPEAALRVSGEYRQRIDLLLTDLSMPGMSGRELGDRLRERRPGLRVIYMSGYSAEEATDQGLLDPSSAFVQKPFGPAKLAAEVSRVLGVGR